MSGALGVFEIAARAMGAQVTRLGTIASNLANAGSVAGSAETAYQARKPLFATAYGDAAHATVDVDRIVTARLPPERRRDPAHPLADANGDVWVAAVDANQELVEMVETARHYANNVEVMATAKSLLLETLRLGR